MIENKKENRNEKEYGTINEKMNRNKNEIEKEVENEKQKHNKTTSRMRRIKKKTRRIR